MSKIQKIISREEIKSRICGLFAYLEENDAGEFKLHKAMDSFNGCYGQIIENIKLPEEINLKINAETLLEGENVYTYRTLMNYYYQYKDYNFKLEPEESETEEQPTANEQPTEEVEYDDNSFIGFIERGIGKVEIDFEELGLTEEDNDLVPHYIYLANVRRLINQYSKLKVVYDYYTGGYQEKEGKLVPSDLDVNTLESDICCICLRYVRMGGTIMFDYLKTLMKTAEDTAKEYYGYAIKGEEIEDKENKLKLGLNVFLNQSIHDIGYLSCYLNQWVGGEEHHEGELYTYGGNTYICVKDNHDVYNKELMRYEFVIDKDHFKKVTEDFEEGTTDENNTTEEEDSKWFDNLDKFISYDNQFGYVFKFYDENGEPLEEQLIDYELSGSADSKLQSMRKLKNYINASDKEETPEPGEDWLYYYKIGQVTSYTTVTDELGNIADIEELENGILKPAGTGDTTNLAAFGNVITNITANKDEHTITFEYVLNTHLRATDSWYITDDDGNIIYKYGDFIYDGDDKYHGVKYTETYTYEEGGELDNLVKNGETYTITIDGQTEEKTFTFEDYINDVDDNCVTYNKYAFNTGNSTIYYNKLIDKENITFSYIKSDYTAQIKNEADYLFSDVFHTDYLNGITYKPTVEADVRINRGNYSAFERHLKLGEVKTMEDMENYSNNSFFHVQKVN